MWVEDLLKDLVIYFCNLWIINEKIVYCGYFEIKLINRLLEVLIINLFIGL